VGSGTTSGRRYGDWALASQVVEPLTWGSLWSLLKRIELLTYSSRVNVAPFPYRMDRPYRLNRRLSIRPDQPDRPGYGLRTDFPRARLASNARRVALSLSSGEYLLGAAIVLILPCDESLHQTRGDTGGGAAGS
jgi:hypothetical protein